MERFFSLQSLIDFSDIAAAISLKCGILTTETDALLRTKETNPASPQKSLLTWQGKRIIAECLFLLFMLQGLMPKYKSTLKQDCRDS